MRTTVLMLVAPTLACGLEAIAGEIDAAIAEQMKQASEASSSGSTGEAATPTTGAAPDPVQTATGGPADGSDESAAAASTSDPVDDMASGAAPPPEVLLFAAEPAVLSEVGVSSLQLETSPDVVAVRLFAGEIFLGEFAPAEFPYSFEVTSDRQDGTHPFTVEVRNADGATTTAMTGVVVDVPASGTVRCTFIEADGVSSELAGVASVGEELLAVGSIDLGAGPRMALWRVEARSCDRVGAVKTIGDWSVEKDWKDVDSKGADIFVDAQGDIHVAGNLTVGGKPRRYLAKLNAQGSLLWERVGAVGQAVARITVDAGTVFSAGSERTQDDPPLHDGYVWGYSHAKKFEWHDRVTVPLVEGEKDDPLNARDEQVRDVVVVGPNLFVFGGREYIPQFQQDKMFHRSFVLRYHPLGQWLETSWSSSGDVLLEDGITAVARVDDGMVGVGWSKDVPFSSPRQALTRWFDAGGKHLGRRPDDLGTATEIRAVCQNREGDVVVTAIQTKVGHTDVWTFAFADAAAERRWSVFYDGMDKSFDASMDLTSDNLGYSTWVGFTVHQKQLRAILRTYNP